MVRRTVGGIFQTVVIKRYVKVIIWKIDVNVILQIVWDFKLPKALKLELEFKHYI